MHWFAVLVALSVMGCATQPVTVDKALAAPPSRILATQWLVQAPFTGSSSSSVTAVSWDQLAKCVYSSMLCRLRISRLRKR
jgi:hypothetical protein